ncbi:MAG: hypothetical protein V1702_03595 [Candidatus Woesearchaeota archaeon]
MSKKSKNKKKKVNAKRERYAKFKKEKPAVLSLTMPELTPEQMKAKQEDERRIDFFLSHSRNPPTQENNERRMKSKR